MHTVNSLKLPSLPNKSPPLLSALSLSLSLSLITHTHTHTRFFTLSPSFHSFRSFHLSLLSYPLQNKHFVGVPFLFGAFPVLLAILVACCIKDKGPLISRKRSEEDHRSSSPPISLLPDSRELRHSVSGNS